MIINPYYPPEKPQIGKTMSAPGRRRKKRKSAHGGFSWSSYWATLISATVEQATPTDVVLTFPIAVTTVATDITCTVNGVTRVVSSASWAGVAWTVVLASAIEYGDVVVMTFKLTNTAAVTNNIVFPIILSDGHTLNASDFKDETSITKDGANRTSAVAVYAGADNPFLQAGADAIKPIWSAEGLTFNAQWMQTAAIAALDQPTTVYLMVKNILSAFGTRLMDGETENSLSLTQWVNNSELVISAGSWSAVVIAEEYYVTLLELVYNGANGSIRSNENASVTGDFGAANGGKITLGAKFDGSAGANFLIAGGIWRDVVDNATDKAAIRKFLNVKYGTGLPVIETGSLTSTGDGTGVSTLTLRVSSTITVILNNNAHFYTDAAGTLNESQTWTVVPGADKTMYIKCTSGTSAITISDVKKILDLKEWVSAINAASMALSISSFLNVNTLVVAGNNTLTGSVTNLTIATNITVLGNNTITGSVTGLIKLLQLNVWGENTLSGSITNMSDLAFLSVKGYNTLSGDVTLLTDLTKLHCEGVWPDYGHNTLTGDISGLTNLTILDVLGEATLTGSIAGLVNIVTLITGTSCTVTGSCEALTSMTWFDILGTTSTVSGDISAMTQLEYIFVNGANTLTGSVTNLTDLTMLHIRGNNTVSGDIAPLVSDLEELVMEPCRFDTYTQGATWANQLVTINPSVGFGYSSAEIDDILIDMAASVALISQTITLQGSNAVRTAASDAAVATLTGVGRTNILVLNT